MHSSYFVLKNKEGKQAEQLVKDYLTGRGYTVQDVSEEQDNYQNDIDFIVQKDGRTSKIEVKLDTRLAETQNIAFEDVFYLKDKESGQTETREGYYHYTPFGLLVRKVAKLDHDAAMQAFSKFINDESLNAKQIAFVQKVIHYIEQNGYAESKAVLMKPPFDQPILFTRLFDGKTGSELMETINSVKENATHVTA